MPKLENELVARLSYSASTLLEDFQPMQFMACIMTIIHMYCLENGLDEIKFMRDTCTIFVEANSKENKEKAN